MGIRSDNEIYSVLEHALREADQPLTCVALMEIPAVRKAALEEFGQDVQIATNKLSDTLGFMWRRDVLSRYLAQTEGRARARYAYSWREKEQITPSPLPAPSSSIKRKKPVFTVIESDTDVTIEFENVTLIVKRRE